MICTRTRSTSTKQKTPKNIASRIVYVPHEARALAHHSNRNSFLSEVAVRPWPRSLVTRVPFFKFDDYGQTSNQSVEGGRSGDRCGVQTSLKALWFIARLRKREPAQIKKSFTQFCNAISLSFAPCLYGFRTNCKEVLFTLPCVSALTGAYQGEL